LRKSVKILLLIVISSIVAACSEGSGTGIGGTGFDGTPVTVKGPITGFGSIIVNGIKFDLANANIVVDDAQANANDLALGMFVTIHGVLQAEAQGTALSVFYDDELQGPIENVQRTADPSIVIVTILDTQVRVDSVRTAFGQTSIEKLQAGDLVTVSGFREADGTIVATRIEREEDYEEGRSEVEIKGFVSQLSGSRFVIGRYEIDIQNAVLEDFDGMSLQQGQYVEVEGTLLGLTIMASKVELEDDEDPAEGTYISYQGIIDEDLEGGKNINGLPLSLGSIAEDEDVIVGSSEVEINGVVDNNGAVLASSVIDREGGLRFEARVNQIDVATRRLSLSYVPGSVEILVDAGTLITSDEGDESEILLLSQISIGEFVKVRARKEGKDVIANQIHTAERKNYRITAPVTACADGQIELIGLIFRLVDGITEYDTDEGPESAAGFCAVAGFGVPVTLEDSVRALDGIADEIEIEE